MNSPQRQEMDKLRTIQSQLESVADRIAQRLPQQRSHLAAFVCVHKWRLHTLNKTQANVYTHEFVDATVKKIRMEVGAFEYATKEQGELLTRALFQLDDILSHGDAEIKETRKALVVAIQAELENADALKASATKLKNFTETMISRLPTAASPEPEPTEAESVEDKNMETVAAEDENEDMESEATESVASHDDEEEEEQEDADEEEELEEEEQEEAEHEEPGFDLRSLPAWRPYYQLQQRADGVYLHANLHGVDPRHVRVEATPETGVLRISGFKLPTRKDLLLSRMSGSPTFGRFEIAERFPTNQLSLEHATQQLTRDGTLQVRLPFYRVYQPRVVRRVSPYQPSRLVVW